MKIEIENGQVLNTVASVCQVGPTGPAGPTGPVAMSEDVRSFIIANERERMSDKSFVWAVSIIKELEKASDLARSKNYGEILMTYGSFNKMYKSFEDAYRALNRFFIQAVAPSTFDYDEVIQACSRDVIRIEMSALVCPVCKLGRLEFAGIGLKREKLMIREGVDCSACGYSPAIDIVIT